MARHIARVPHKRSTERFAVRVKRHDDDHEIMTAQEVADYLRVSYVTVLRLIKDGAFDAWRVGVQWRIRRESVLRRLRE